MSVDVIVIGAGISGLTTAVDLTQRGYSVKVLERQVHAGGNAVSRRFDGFLMEQGPTTLNAAMPGATEHLQALGLATTAETLGPNVKKRYLRNSHGLHGISTHPLGFFLSGYLSAGERLSMAAEILRGRKSGNAEETIHQFASRRFGTGFADKVIEPMAAGIFMGDSKDLSIDGAFPRLSELEQRYGSILRGVLAAKRGSEPGRHMVSWPQGIGTIPRKLCALLGDKVHKGVTVTGICKTPDGFKVKTASDGILQSRAVVLAVQPHVTASLLETLDPEGALAAAKVAAPPVGVVFLGYHKSQVGHLLDGLGFLSTKTKRQLISGAQFASTMFEGRAPKDHVAISCYTGGTRNPEIADMGDGELADCVQRELGMLMDIKGEPVVCRTHRWHRGLPQYSLGHRERREALENMDKRVHGLFATGNYLGGVSVVNCMSTAAKTARQVARALETDKSGFHDYRAYKR